MKQYGFDKPAHERYFKMLGDFARFDLGRASCRTRACGS
jgi:microcin C transport system permease protein